MKKNQELTEQDIKRQDFVDNTIHDFLSKISEGKISEWSIDDIGMIRDVVEIIICRDHELMTEEQFYPSI